MYKTEMEKRKRSPFSFFNRSVIIFFVCMTMVSGQLSRISTNSTGYLPPPTSHQQYVSGNSIHQGLGQISTITFSSHIVTICTGIHRIISSIKNGSTRQIQLSNTILLVLFFPLYFLYAVRVMYSLHKKQSFGSH